MLKPLFIATFETPLGLMQGIADETHLHRLEFEDQKKNTFPTQTLFEPGKNAILNLLGKELDTYFKGKLTTFSVPLALDGTTFQKMVWQKLQTIPCGTTRSYQELAHAVNNPQGCRAVAQANARNKIALLIPCHRIINKDGKIGGYAGSVARKDWLLKHEEIHAALQQ